MDPLAVHWSGPPLAAQWSGPPLAAQWSGPPLAVQWSGPPLAAQWSGPPLAAHWSGPPLAAQWSGPPLAVHWSGPPLAVQWSGPPLAAQWSGPPLAAQWSGPPLAAQWSGPPLAVQWSDIKSYSVQCMYLPVTVWSMQVFSWLRLCVMILGIAVLAVFAALQALVWTFSENKRYTNTPSFLPSDTHADPPFLFRKVDFPSDVVSFASCLAVEAVAWSYVGLLVLLRLCVVVETVTFFIIRDPSLRPTWKAKVGRSKGHLVS